MKRAPIPAELRIYSAIERFGVKAVIGRGVLTAREIESMQTANLINKLYQQREASGAWAEWESKNPREAEVLSAAHRIWEASKGD